MTTTTRFVRTTDNYSAAEVAAQLHAELSAWVADYLGAAVEDSAAADVWDALAAFASEHLGYSDNASTNWADRHAADFL